MSQANYWCRLRSPPPRARAPPRPAARIALKGGRAIPCNIRREGGPAAAAEDACPASCSTGMARRASLAARQFGQTSREGSLGLPMPCVHGDRRGVLSRRWQEAAQERLLSRVVDTGTIWWQAGVYALSPLPLPLPQVQAMLVLDERQRQCAQHPVPCQCHAAAPTETRSCALCLFAFVAVAVAAFLCVINPPGSFASHEANAPDEY